MNKMQFPKSNGQKLYEDIMCTLMKIAADFNEQQLIDLMEFGFDIQRENIAKRK